jgi:hypothetical protein
VTNKQSKQKIQNKQTRGESHNGLAIYIKKYINTKKKNYGNSNIPQCKNIIFKKISKKIKKSFKIL